MSKTPKTKKRQHLEIHYAPLGNLLKAYLELHMTEDQLRDARLPSGKLADVRIHPKRKTVSFYWEEDAE